MEIFILVLLYYLSQNPDFAESVKPIMSKLKDSEHMLSFLNDLARFSQAFGEAPEKSNCHEKEKHAPEKETCKQNPQSPTTGIADEFIQHIIDSYLQKHP